MKKIKILSIVFLLAFVFALSACGIGPASLAAPQNVVLAGTVISWDEVDGAEYYEVRASRNYGCTAETKSKDEILGASFDLSELELPAGKTYRITVRAKATGEYGQILRGEWSVSIAFEN